MSQSKKQNSESVAAADGASGRLTESPLRTAVEQHRLDRQAFRSAARLFVGFSVATALIALALGQWFQTRIPLFETESSVPGNLGFFLLINLNIVIVMILGFLVVKNIVKLVLDRRKNILGSKLRARLVTAFVGLSLIPAVLLFTVAQGIVERVLQGWFSPQVAASVDGALDIAKLHYEQSETELFRQVEHLSASFARVFPVLPVSQTDADVQGTGPAQATGLVQPTGTSARTDVPGRNRNAANRAKRTDQLEADSGLVMYLEAKRKEYGLHSLTILDAQNRILFEVRDRSRAGSFFPVPAPNIAATAKARTGAIIVRPEQSLNAEFLRAYAPIPVGPPHRLSNYSKSSEDAPTVEPPRAAESIGTTGGAAKLVELVPALTDLSAPPTFPGEQGLLTNATRQSLPVEANRSHLASPGEFTLVATRWVLPALSQALAHVIDAHDDYAELRTYHRPLASSYSLTLVIVTLLVIFAAVWVGFYLARGLSVPIGLLAEGTAQVAHGNLDFHIPELGDDELGVLVRSFNTMTQDLKSTNAELISRRRYMETVLAQVGVGVISLDIDGRVATCNSTALTILGLTNASQLERKLAQDVFPKTIANAVVEMREILTQRDERLLAQPVVLLPEEGSKHVQLTLTRLVVDSGQDLGAVLLLDDITELVGAQRMAAWRDVARRIAHEIKNPLTPIQLNAQRIQRKFGAPATSQLLPVQILRETDRTLINEATEMIVKQVEILRNLVNEFSRFARMPKAQLVTSDLGEAVQQSVAFFREAHPNIDFRTSLDPSTPLFAFDKEQISRVLVNLLTNSVSAIETAHAACPESAAMRSPEPASAGTIEVSVEYNPGIDLVTLEVADSGVGISAEDKPKLFEPYFSTKRSGTGLGLAIVSSIIADHSGHIRVRDNRPRGARFSIELPVKREALRKLA